MKNITKKVMGMALAFSLVTAANVSAASIYNYTVSTGIVTLGTLNKTSSVSAEGETVYVPYSGYGNSYRAYVYVSARNSEGTTLNATQGYGDFNATMGSRSYAFADNEQPGAATWMSTHRSNDINDYGYNLINN